MSQTSIQTVTEPRAQPASPSPVVESRPRIVHPTYKVVKALASLRLTVFLFVLSLLLVFLGTLAQVDEGIWTVVYKYFRSGLVWVPFQGLLRFGQTFFGVNKDLLVSGTFPFPGGWLIGSLLLANLLAAHAIRFKLSWKRSGILLIHGGLIVMMLGELVTGLYAIEGNMTIPQGDKSNYLEIRNDVELALISHTDPRMDDVTVVPGRKLQREKEIKDVRLPFDVEVVSYLPNSGLVGKRAARDKDNLATAGVGLEIELAEKPQGAGVDQDSKFDMPAAYLTFKDKEGKSLGTYLMSPWLDLLQRTQQITVDNKTYEVSLRFKRTYKPYTMHLLKASHDVYPGTTIPKNYSSLVRLTDPENKEDRTVLIYMNQPLRYRGETFYQSGMNGTTTILQVVRNPGWLMPYFSCALVSLGMIIHFVLSLQTFLGRRAAS